MRYAEYITYGADAAVLSADMINGDGHGMVCFGLEFKENASDVSYNSRWNGKDARMLIYNVNCTEHSIGDYIYVNLSDGNWYWNGSRVFGNAYVQSQCLLTLTHSYNKMLSAADPDQFFAAIRN